MSDSLLSRFGCVLGIAIRAGRGGVTVAGDCPFTSLLAENPRVRTHRGRRCIVADADMHLLDGCLLILAARAFVSHPGTLPLPRPTALPAASSLRATKYIYGLRQVSTVAVDTERLAR